MFTSIRWIVFLFGSVFLFCDRGFSAEEAVPKTDTIESGRVRVVWNTADATFSVEKTGWQRPPIVQGKLRDGKATAEVVPLDGQSGIPSLDTLHKRLGDGRAIRVTYADGGADWLCLFGDCPMVFILPTFAHSQRETQTIAKSPVIGWTLDLPVEKAEQLRALGTAGLTPLNGHPGSYVFLAAADPQTRAGVVAGWLTHHRGDGIVFSDIADGRGRMSARVDYGRLPVPPNTVTPGEVLVVGAFDDARLGLELFADLVASYYDIHLHPQPAGYCTWYSSPNGGASDEVHLRELTADAAEKLKPFGFDFIQIDDKWQEGKERNGPAKNFYTHRADGPYPSGMKGAADDIAAHGLMPGIWFMPFAGDHEDPFFQQHLDWFVKKPDGAPYSATWGGTSLDMTNPETQKYVFSVVERISKDWGYRYFKMDGLWTGTATKLLYVNDAYQDDDLGQAVFHDPTKTNVEAFRDGFKLVRRAAGDDVFFLGCCVPQNMRSFGASFGLVDAMRIGPDNGSNWGGLKEGPWHGTNRYFLHRRVWYNDPDPVYLRTSIPIEHAQLICSWVAVTGQLDVFSEWLPALPPERVEVYRRSIPSHGLKPRPVDLFETGLATAWLLTDEPQDGPRRDVVGLFNWDEHQPLAFDMTTRHIGLPEAESYVAFDYWNNRFVPPFRERLQQTLPGGTCMILSVRPAVGYPQVIGTSRHITQGIIDLHGEQWDAASAALSGKSDVVGGDPYELRIVVPVGENSWKATVVGVLLEDANADVTCRLEQNGPELRVTFDSKESRQVSWSVQFEPAAVSPPVVRPVENLQSGTDRMRRIVLSWNSRDGRRFRITRDDHPEKTFETTDTTWTDTDFEANKLYRYTVRAVGWTDQVSEPAAIELTAPEPIRLPPLPPEPEVSISTLEPLKATTGWGTIGKNLTCEQKPLTLQGKRYEQGYGVHAPSTLVFAVPPGKTRFVAVVGLDDERKEDPRRSITARLFVEGKDVSAAALAESPVLSNQTLPIWHFDVTLPAAAERIRLEVDEAGDGDACDHADWVQAGFLAPQ